MDGNQMKRIEQFLETQGLNTSVIPKKRIEQLQKIDNAIQRRLTAITEAQQILRDNSISIAAIL